MPTPPNATRADIIAMLQDGHSNSRISRELRCDKPRVARIRRELGLPNYVRTEQTRTVEEKWALFAKPVDGGHMEWTGARGTSCGTPVLAYKGKLPTAAAIAFRIKHGRDPEGRVQPECGMRHCVAPDHVQDEPGRLAARGQLRPAHRKPYCNYGHDQAQHRRYESDGTPYCAVCKAEHRRGERTPQRDVRPAIAALLRDNVPAIRIARQLHVGTKTVIAVRADLGMPSPGPGRRPQQASVEAAFLACIEHVDGGHARWTGTWTKNQPLVLHRGSRESAYRVAFRVHHGREPEGQVRPACAMPGCVAGAHVEDRPMRQRTDSLYAAIFGVAS